MSQAKLYSSVYIISKKTCKKCFANAQNYVSEEDLIAVKALMIKTDFQKVFKLNCPFNLTKGVLGIFYIISASISIEHSYVNYDSTLFLQQTVNGH